MAETVRDMSACILRATTEAIFLVDEITKAHSKATEENPMAGIVLLDLIEQAVSIKNKLKLMAGACNA